MAYWLVKSEPTCWSWEDQVDKGVTAWDGVRNYQARNNLMAMRVGDLAFFYHSVTQKRIVGIVEVVAAYYPDPSDPTGRFGQVDVRTVCDVPCPVTLEMIKSDPFLAQMPLVTQSRLSVMPVTPEQWAMIAARGGVDAVSGGDGAHAT